MDPDGIERRKINMKTQRFYFRVSDDISAPF